MPCASGVTCGPAVNFDVANDNLVLYQLASVSAGAPPAPAGAWTVMGCRTTVLAPMHLGYVSSVAECINLGVIANVAYLAISVVGSGDFTGRACRGAAGARERAPPLRARALS